MGNNRSVRATHFTRAEDADPVEDDTLEKHHINISNKMVERLVEDATLVARIDTPASNPKEDYREKMFIEKLRDMDDSHSQRSGLTENEMKALMTRVEMRTANMGTPEPVCEDVKDKIIECYNLSHPDEIIKCWDTIGEFSQCVQDAATKRLHARNEREMRENELRSRHVARAREYALKELSSDDEEKRKL